MRVRFVVALVSRANPATVTQLRSATWRALAAPGSNFSHLAAGSTLYDRRRAPTNPEALGLPQSVCFRPAQGILKEEMHWSPARPAPKTKYNSAKSPLFTFSNGIGHGRN